MEVDTIMDVPMCSVCNHRHEEGVKCSICGHTGKAKVFQLLKKNVVGKVFKVLGFDDLANTGESMSKTASGLWSFIQMLRPRIFPGLAPELPEDKNSRHLVAFVGDGPIGIARWRVSPEDATDFAIIEYMGILENKRLQGYGKQLINYIVQDVHKVLQKLMTHVDAIVADVPNDPQHAGAVKAFQSCGFQVHNQNIIANTNGFKHIRLVRYA